MHTDKATLGERYEIIEKLGLKGVSLVYRAYDRADGREVVLKRVAPNPRDKAKYTEKDLVEDAIALASLKNPNFLTIYDYGKDQGGPFMVAEPLQGVILEATLQKNPLSVEDFICLVKQTLESLIAAHEAGLTGVHLDPWNIMLLRQAGGRYRVKILGLGRSAASTLPILKTDYAFEQEDKVANPWSEFLSLGRLYYQALTGSRPFGNVESSLAQGSPAMEKLVPCHSQRPDVPVEMADWVMWLIHSADREPGLTAEQVLERFLAICAEFEKASSEASREAASAAASAATTVPTEATRQSLAVGEAHAGSAQYAERLMKAQAAAEADARLKSNPPLEAVEPAIASAGAAAMPAAHFRQARPPAFATRPAQPQSQASPAWPSRDAPIFQARSKETTPPVPTTTDGDVPIVDAKPAPAFPAESGSASGTDAPPGSPAEPAPLERPHGWSGREETSPGGGGDSAGPSRTTAARPGEVPLADGRYFRRIESHGVFLPAPNDAVFPEDLKWDGREEPAAKSAEAAMEPGVGEAPSVVEKAPETKPEPARKGDTEIPDIVLPGIESPAAGFSDVDSRRAEPGPREAPEPERKPESVPTTGFAWPTSRPAADSLRAEAAEPALAGTATGTGAGSWRVPVVALAVLLFASFIVLAGSLTKSRSGRNKNGNGNSTNVAPVATPTAEPVAEVAMPAVRPVVPASMEGNAEAADAPQAELLSEAKAAEARGDDLAAISHYMTAMRSYPDNAEVKAAAASYIDSLAERPPDVVGFLDRALVECAEEFGIGAALRLLGERAMAIENWDDAYRWLSEAALVEDVPGTRLLGLLLSTGQGTPKDLEAAAECFEWAADKGDLSASYLAGECYVLGKGVEKNPAKGIVFLEAPAAAGDLRAIDLMGVCHAHGLGTATDYGKALACFREAVEGGYPAALANLGVLYIQGQGVKQDAETAVEYFREGAEANNATCMFYYAKCFEKGLGVEASHVSAVEWYGRAAAAGSEEAREWFATLGEETAN